MEPFAAVGGPGQTPAWWQELAAAGIVCMCGSLAEPWDVVEDAAPYLWPTGPTPEQADAHLLELVGKQLVGKNAEFAGDDAMQAQDRGLRMDPGRDRDRRVHGAQRRVRRRSSQDEYGGEIAARSTYFFDPARRPRSRRPRSHA